MVRGFLFSLLTLGLIVPLYGNDWVFSGAIPGGHRGKVNAIVHKGDVIISAGEDGFLEIWKPNNGSRSGQAAQRFQVSPYRIIAAAPRPEKDEVCLVESDGMGLCRVSAWNYHERRNIFTQWFREPIAHVFYSMNGNFIIAAAGGRSGIVLLDSASGSTIPSPQNLSGNINLAVTGKSERNMLVYLTSGALSYWDLQTNNETNHFSAPPNLFSPVLFSNNRYLAGVNAEGLAVINAVTGELMARDNSVPDESLLYASGDNFFCLIQKENASAQIYRYTIDRSGKLSKAGNFSLSGSIGRENNFTAIAVNGNDIVLGTSAGSLALCGANGQLQILNTKAQISIIDADISGTNIAFITGSDTIGFIPLQYSQLNTGRTLNFEQNTEAYNRITAFAEENGTGGQFVFWQDRNTQTPPLLRSFGPNSTKTVLGDVSFRSPVIAANSYAGKAVFMDSTGNLAVVSPLDTEKNRPFTFFSVGLMDIAFVDNNRLIIGRSAVSGNSPFMIININTGETVPLPYPSQAAVSLHRGSSGSIYAAAISSDGSKTSLVQLDIANTAASKKLFDFEGEDTHFSLAESSGANLAAVSGGEEAAIYSGSGIHKLERTAGLPLRLINGGQYLISLDRDGNICWYDNSSGKLLAIFKLHPDGWTLQTEQRTINGRLN